MQRCPNEVQLLLYASGSLSEPEHTIIEEHLKTCRECSGALTTWRQTELLAQHDVLPPVTLEEQESARKRVLSLFDSSVQKGQTVSTPRPFEGFKSMMQKAAQVSIAAGAALLGNELAPISPMLTADNKNHHFFPDDVRNDTETASISHDNENDISEHFKEGNLVMSEQNEAVHAPKNFGLPESENIVSPLVNQYYSDTCAIRSQELILHDFGIELTQEQLIAQAQANGWYTEGGGTPIEDVGKLLEINGVEISRYDNGNVYNLANELAQGHRVIVGVDADELWHGGILQDIYDTFLGESANHALIVAGLDTTDPNNVKVILTDPGTGDVAKSYPLDQFLDAWNDSGNLMISTNDPAPINALGMSNFDYQRGHLASIDHQNYSSWLSQNEVHMDIADYVTGMSDVVHNFVDDITSPSLGKILPDNAMPTEDTSVTMDDHIPDIPTIIADTDGDGKIDYIS